MSDTELAHLRWLACVDSGADGDALSAALQLLNAINLGSPEPSWSDAEKRRFVLWVHSITGGARATR